MVWGVGIDLSDCQIFVAMSFFSQSGFKVLNIARIAKGRPDICH